MKAREKKYTELKAKMSELKEKENAEFEKLKSIKEKMKVLQAQIEEIEAEKRLEDANEISEILKIAGLDFEELKNSLKNGDVLSIQDKLDKAKAEPEKDSENK